MAVLNTVRLNARPVVEIKIYGYMLDITLTSIRNMNTLDTRTAEVSHRRNRKYRL